MTLIEAYEVLDLDFDHSIDLHMIKEQYWWLIKFYHPHSDTAHDGQFRKIIEAYRIIMEMR